MLSFKEAWEREVEMQRKEYFDRVGGSPSSSTPPLRPGARPLPVPAPASYTQAWSELGGMSRIRAQQDYERAVKAQQDMYTGKNSKRFMAAIEKLERFRG